MKAATYCYYLDTAEYQNFLKAKMKVYMNSYIESVNNLDMLNPSGIQLDWDLIPKHKPFSFLATTCTFTFPMFLFTLEYFQLHDHSPLYQLQTCATI